MDKPFSETLREGLTRLAIDCPPAAFAQLETHAAELLKWNAKVNLTALTTPVEVAEKHFLDSLTVLPEVQGASSLLDLGSGGGFPGLPLAVMVPTLSVTLVDAVQKKVSFLKTAIARLGLANRVKAVHLRAEGKPQAEHLPLVEVVIARALTEPAELVALGVPYLRPRGRVVAMMGRSPAPEELARVAAQHGCTVSEVRHLTLPFSQDPRSIACFQRA